MSTVLETERPTDVPDITVAPPSKAATEVANDPSLPGQGQRGEHHLHTVDIDAVIRASQEDLRQPEQEDVDGSEASSVPDNVQWV